jgi:hypothetical protein
LAFAIAAFESALRNRAGILSRTFGSSPAKATSKAVEMTALFLSRSFQAEFQRLFKARIHAMAEDLPIADREHFLRAFG